MIAAAALAAFVAHQPLLAGPLEDGTTAFDSGDYATALAKLRPLAIAGNPIAQNGLGFMYGNGKGVPQDHTQAAFWFRKAAEQGIADAQNNIGLMYDYGQGVTQDYLQAHKWFNLAGARLADADRREKAVRNRDRVAAKMTPAQIAEAQRLASIWKPQ